VPTAPKIGVSVNFTAQTVLPVVEHRTNAWTTLNVGTIGTMSDGQIGDRDRRQDDNSANLDEARRLIEAVQARRDEIEATAGPEDAEVFRKLICDVEMELEKPKPDKVLVKEAIETLSRILEKGATGALAERAKQLAISLASA